MTTLTLVCATAAELVVSRVAQTRRCVRFRGDSGEISGSKGEERESETNNK